MQPSEVLKISQNSQGNTFDRVSFLIKLQAETLAQRFACESCKIFKNTFFMKHIWWLDLNMWSKFSFLDIGNYYRFIENIFIVVSWLVLLTWSIFYKCISAGFTKNITANSKTFLLILAFKISTHFLNTSSFLGNLVV